MLREICHPKKKKKKEETNKRKETVKAEIVSILPEWVGKEGKGTS